jgi:type II secretory pathway predicted ATPase ExeA
MKLRKHICWEPREVHKVIKIDAEAVSDSVFRAVHTPQPILMSTTSPDNLKTVSDRDFLNAFTNPDTPEVFSLVLGDSGAGKTHFIHWLRLNVQTDKKTRVVNIPKVGTSLRSIVKKIIRQLPEELQAQYLNKLTTIGGETHTLEQLQDKLLDSLAQAVSAEATRGNEQDMERQEILKGLAPLFRDPHIRSQWFLASEKNSIIQQLSHHVFNPNKTYNRLEQDRRFSVSDFNIQGVHQANVALPTRHMLEYFRSDSRYMNMAAELANQCLDAAIGEALSFSGEDLVALVAEVRKHLHEQGVSLIIYIEDLSRMQGVDKALLDALTTPSNQGGKKLCPIRWVAAMTTGYFDRLEATIGTRINLFGMVEATPEIWEGNEAQEKLALFIGRYLNAVRLGIEKLEKCEHDEVDLNACDVCQYRDHCHDTFGSGGGFGMYPFTPKALWNMAVRSTKDDVWFKPRRLLKSILTPMLAQYGPDIVKGTFPPWTMINDLGGERLDTAEIVKLKRMAGIDSDRHIVLQELWRPETKVVQLPDEMLAAFDLVPLQGIGGDDANNSPNNENKTKAKPPIPSKTNDIKSLDTPDPIIDKLRDWGNRQGIDDQVAQKVRGLVFDALIEYIDWDLLGVSRGTYVGKSKPFNRTSIVFEEQATQSRASIKLNIPLDKDKGSFSNAAMALQGLYLFEKNKHWDFENGHLFLVVVQNCLEEWAQAAEILVREFAPNDERWNAIDAATELLAVGAALSGTIDVNSIRKEVWYAIWRDAPAPPSSRLLSNEMQRMARDISDKWGKLQVHVKAHSFGTKGSRATNFLNSEKREATLVRLMKNKWHLCMTPDPESAIPSDFKEIASLYVKVSKNLRPALEAEAMQYRRWREEMDAQFGNIVLKADIIKAFEELQQALNDGAILLPEGDRFHQNIEAFKTANYKDARVRAKMVTELDTEKLAPYLFAKNGVVDAMHKGRALAEAAERYLALVANYHDNRMDELEGTAGEGLQSCWNGIEIALQDLYAILGRLANNDNAGGQK